MIDSPLSTGIESITNTASANAIQILLAISASVTNVVVNPSSGSAEIISYVWLDSDSDGIKDIGEPGLANVEVTLKDQFGTPIATATTDGTGRYVFAGIEPGNGYYVEVTAGTLPAGLTQSAPAGHSDNRTNAFNLAAGQSYTTADLGYKPAPGTATLGDSIWSDADGNGTRDPGEPGLAGVTAQLWLDVNDNGLIEPGTDVLTVSTVTAPGGSYLFAGVAATGTEDYIVFVDNTQAALTGFSQIKYLHPKADPSSITESSIAGGMLKATGTMEDGTGPWKSPNVGATNTSGFSAEAGGARYEYGTFIILGMHVIYWTSTEYDADSVWFRILDYGVTDIYRDHEGITKGMGLSCALYHG